MIDRIARQELKRARRAARERELAAKTIEAARSLGRKVHGVVLADPTWTFKVYSETSGQDRGACNHYPTMSVAEIKALKIPAAKDAVLFLWATVPMLPQALEVMAAWGFTYKSHFVWVKNKRGTGFWNRNRHELLLIGTRGHVPCPAPGMQFDSVIEAARGRHSEKPAIVRDMIAAMFPNVPKLEMFARGERVAGWDFWGNEALSVHQVSFETNRTTGEWRAHCSCGWTDTQPTKKLIDSVAARHDLVDETPSTNALGEILSLFGAAQAKHSKQPSKEKL